MEESIIISLFFICIILLQSLSDALYDNGKKDWAGIGRAGQTAILLVFILIVLCPSQLPVDPEIIANDPIRLIIGYVLLRYAIFDFSYNLARGLPFTYVGTSKIYDRFWRWFFSWSKIPQGHFLVWTKILSFILGSGMIYQIYF